MPVGAADVAREIRARLLDVEVKKLHKLLYLCQGHHLAFAGVPMFPDRLSAWDHGPVAGQLWRREKNGETPLFDEELDESRLNTIGYVLSRYGRLSGRDLEGLTHAQEPWLAADRDRAPGESVPIEIAVMTRYFRAAADDSDDAMPFDRDAVRSWLATADHQRERPAEADSPEELRRRIADAS